MITGPLPKWPRVVGLAAACALRSYRGDQRMGLQGIDEPIHVLHEWQQLLGAIIGALALVITVWRILGAERRRRNEAAKALRAAVGIEFRQIARRSLPVQ